MMEWKQPVNDLLKDDITKINGTLVPPGYQGSVRSTRALQESVARLVDALGEQSAAAQGLNKVITTADKLKAAPDHVLYLLKDARAHGGLGEVIGLLKVGRKHLYLYDDHHQPWEVEPLCVLDFFVVADRQRHGYGKILFDHMLQDVQSAPHELAVDGPSPKMEHFLAKNYGVRRLLRQNNNFVVAPAFFTTAENLSRSGRSTPALAPAPASPGLVGRFAAAKPPSIIATVIHGGAGAADGYHQAASGDGSPRSSSPAPEESAECGALASSSPTPAPSPTRTPERPSSLRVEPAAGCAATSPAREAAGKLTPRRDSQVTDRGYFDMKFYHNRLW